MTKRYIYLAGPIAGCNKGQANDWRKYASDKLTEISPNIIGISPLRCEPMIGRKYKLGYDDPKFGTSKAISSKNLFDVRNCDMTLAYFPKEMNDIRPSIGTILEVALVYGVNKPVIMISDDNYYLNHPVLDVCVSWKLKTLEEAFEVIEGVLKVYA